MGVAMSRSIVGSKNVATAKGVFCSGSTYALHLAAGTSTGLTTGNDYDEHPVTVYTRSGDWIVYMSS